MKIAAALAMMAALGAALPARADDTFHRHKGFFVRLDAEGGYLNTKASQGNTTLTFSGGGGGIGFGIGGALAENVILYFHVYDLLAFNPSVSDGTNTVSTSNTSLGTVGYGLGFSYYFMPTNLYLSITLAAAALTSETNNVRSNAKIGPGGRLAFGKEWWVSDHWGLGLAGQLSFAWNKDSDAADAPTWATVAPSIAFSATFN